MADLCPAGRDSVDAQRELFRLAAKECGLTIPVIAGRSPLSISTMKGWRDGAAMPAWAIGALGEAGVPDHLLSLITDPFGRAVLTPNPEDGDLEVLGREGAHFLAEHADARADGTVTPIERSKLKERARRIEAVARRVAA